MNNSCIRSRGGSSVLQMIYSKNVWSFTVIINKTFFRRFSILLVLLTLCINKSVYNKVKTVTFIETETQSNGDIEIKGLCRVK